MKKLVLVVMVVILAAIVLSLPSFAQGGGAYRIPADVISAFNGGRRDSSSGRSSRGNRSGGAYRIPADVVRDCNGGRDNYDRDDDRGYSSHNRSNRSGGRDRTDYSGDISVRIGGARINLGMLKTVFDKPKQKSTDCEKTNQVVVIEPKQTQTVIINNQPSVGRTRFTVVREDTMVTISPIVVTDASKQLVCGSHIVYKRCGEYLSEYAVSRISEQFVYVKVVDDSLGKPGEGDTFTIIAPR